MNILTEIPLQGAIILHNFRYSLIASNLYNKQMLNLDN
jgi:hypothetical protein